MAEPILAVKQFSVGYGGTAVVRDAQLFVLPSQIVALVGPNGAGKSTLLKGIVGIADRMGGNVWVTGKPLGRLRTDQVVAEGVGYVPQTENVFPSLTVDENLFMGGYLNRSEIRARREEVLGLFPDLKAALRQRAGTLSGGQRNMLAMARGLMARPKLLLLDEPTAGLAPAVVAAVWARIREVAQAGTAVLVVEQNVAAALSHSHWAYVLVAGRNFYTTDSETLGGMDLGAMFLGASPPARGGEAGAYG